MDVTQGWGRRRWRWRRLPAARRVALRCQMAVVTATFQKCGTFTSGFPWKIGGRESCRESGRESQLMTPQQQQECKQQQGCCQQQGSQQQLEHQL
jgi:hypothetical protein